MPHLTANPRLGRQAVSPAPSTRSASTVVPPLLASGEMYLWDARTSRTPEIMIDYVSVRKKFRKVQGVTARWVSADRKHSLELCFVIRGTYHRRITSDAWDRIIAEDESEAASGDFALKRWVVDAKDRVIYRKKVQKLASRPRGWQMGFSNLRSGPNFTSRSSASHNQPTSVKAARHAAKGRSDAGRRDARTLGFWHLW